MEQRPFEEELALERVRNGRVIGGQAAPSAPIQEAGTGHRARRSKRGSKDSQGSPEMAIRSVSEMLSEPAGKAFDAILDSGRTASGRSAGSDDSAPSTPADRSVSFHATLNEVKFNDDAAKISFVTLDVPAAAGLHSLRGAWIRITLTQE